MLIRDAWTIHASIHPSIYLLVHLPTYPFTSLFSSFLLSIHPSFYPCIYPYICLFIHTSMKLSTHSGIHPSTSLSIHLYDTHELRLRAKHFIQATRNPAVIDKLPSRCSYSRREDKQKTCGCGSHYSYDNQKVPWILRGGSWGGVGGHQETKRRMKRKH